MSEVESFSNKYREIEKSSLRIAFLDKVSIIYGEAPSPPDDFVPLNGFHKDMTTEEAFDRAFGETDRTITTVNRLDPELTVEEELASTDEEITRIGEGVAQVDEKINKIQLLRGKLQRSMRRVKVLDERIDEGLRLNAKGNKALSDPHRDRRESAAIRAIAVGGVWSTSSMSERLLLRIELASHIARDTVLIRLREWIERL